MSAAPSAAAAPPRPARAAAPPPGPDLASADPARLREEAMAHHRAGRLAEALPLYAAFLARRPGDAGMWTNLGALFRSQGRHDQAVRAQERALALDPGSAAVRNNLANVLNDIGDSERSLALRRSLIAEAPDDPVPVALAGKSLRALGRLEEGIALLEEGVRRFPDYPEMTIQLALTELAARRYAEGFRHYGARWLTGELTPRRVDAPKWDGGPLGGRTLLVLPEQGFGDALCFARFLPTLRSHGPGRVALLAERPLLRLLADVEGADHVGNGPPPWGFDAWVDMMDLPRLHFEAGLPLPPPTRLAIPEDSRARARALMAPFRDRLKVGVVWCGSVTYRGNAFRSFPHRELDALIDIPGVQLVSLYKGPEIEAFRADGTQAFVVDAGSHDRDFADCAALMEEMDLIVTSDTVTAHLAGSLGRPTWTLLHWDAFWLWGPEGDSTPWYPSMRLIRQARPRDWGGVMAKVRAKLERMVASRAAGRAGVTGPDLLVPVPAGELLDKITILRIKSERIADEAKLLNVRAELAALEAVARAIPGGPALDAVVAELRAVNETLWEVEDAIRDCEARGDFGPEFVRLARAVYVTNDRRAALKREASRLAGSRLVEEKSYAGAPP